MKKNVFLGMFIAVISSCLLLTGCGKKDNVDVNNGGNNNGNNEKIVDTKNGDYFDISTTDLVVPLGSTNTFNISLKNAVGLFGIIVNDSNIVSVDEEKLWVESIDENKDIKEITVTGKEVGTTQITVTLADVTSYDTEEELTGTYTINVTVK